MDILKTVLSHSPRSRQLVEEVADLCLENDQIDYALTLLTGLVHDFPAEFDYVFKAGRACEALGDIDTAISHFSLVEQKEPDRIDVKLRLAACYLAREKVIQADDYVNQVLKIDPDNPEARALRQQL